MNGLAPRLTHFRIGVIVKYRVMTLVALSALLVLAGCTGKVEPDKLNSQIDVFDVKLLSDIDYTEINGVVSTKEPCLHGYERNFEDLDVIIGYGFDNKIRKITTLNSGTSLFGIKPGMSFEEGKTKIIKAGFKDQKPPFTFSAYGYSITFLVDGDNINGLTLEPID